MPYNDMSGTALDSEITAPESHITDSGDGRGTPGPPEQTHGLNGVARPTAGSDVVLAQADQPSTTLVVQSGKTYLRNSW